MWPKSTYETNIGTSSKVDLYNALIKRHRKKERNKRISLYSMPQAAHDTHHKNKLKP